MQRPTPPLPFPEFSAHVAQAFKTVYQYKCGYGTLELPKDGEIARELHGIQHAVTAAIYGFASVNLCRLYGDQEALALTDDDMLSIFDAFLYHDSKREKDHGEDLWDRNSAAQVYLHLEQVGVDTNKAQQLAEATANKEFLAFGSKQSFYCNYVGSADLTWRLSKNPSVQRNFYQRTIHDGDCLHMPRATKQFNKEYLDFYQKYVVVLTNAELSLDTDALNILTLLCMEINKHIEQQGDSVYKRNQEVKKRYEHENAYAVIMESIDEENYPLLFALCRHGLIQADHTLLEKFRVQAPIFDPTKNKFSAENLEALRSQNQVFFRGVPIATGVRLKNASNQSEEEELLSTTEVRKALRQHDKPTRTQKKDSHGNPLNLGKTGNDFRSMSLMADNARMISPVGYIVVPELSKIRSTSIANIQSGIGKKKEWQQLIIDQLYIFSSEEEKNKLLKLNSARTIILTKDQVTNCFNADFFKESKLESTVVLKLDDILLKEIEQMNWHGEVAKNNNDRLKEKLIDLAIAEKNRIALKKFALHIKIGRSTLSGINTNLLNSEIMALVTEHGPAAFTLDHTPTMPMIHPFARILQAVHLEKERQKHYGEAMPIFEFSVNWRGFRKHVYTPNDIKNMWHVMTTDYMKKEFKEGNFEKEFLTLSVDEIKVRSMYGKDEILVSGKKISSRQLPADVYYDKQTQEEINAAINLQRKSLINTYIESIIQKINDDNVSILDNAIFLHLLHIHKMTGEIKKFLSTNSENNADVEIFTTTVKEQILKKMHTEISSIKEIFDLNKLRKLTLVFGLNGFTAELKEIAIRLAVDQINTCMLNSFYPDLQTLVATYQISEEAKLSTAIANRVSADINNVLSFVYTKEPGLFTRNAVVLRRLKILASQAKVDDATMTQIREAAVQVAVNELNNPRLFQEREYDFDFQGFAEFIDEFNLADQMKGRSDLEEVIRHGMNRADQNYDRGAMNQINTLYGQFVDTAKIQQEIKDNKASQVRKKALQIAVNELNNPKAYQDKLYGFNFKRFAQFIKEFDIVSEMEGHSKLEEVIRNCLKRAEQNNDHNAINQIWTLYGPLHLDIGVAPATTLSYTSPHMIWQQKDPENEKEQIKAADSYSYEASDPESDADASEDYDDYIPDGAPNPQEQQSLSS